MNFKGFFDLGLNPPSEEDFWSTLCAYNIRTVAINQYFEATMPDESKKRKNEKKEFIIPAPVTCTVPEKFRDKITVVKRLTVNLSDGSLLYKIVHSSNFKLYDIIAVVPATHTTLQTCCASNDIDLICFDPLNKPQWTISRKLYNIALQKNIFFEIQYSHVISDNTARRNTIQVAHSYYTLGKLKNIIITSGADKSMLLRSPYDVINFCFLFGFNENEAKKAITSNPKELLNRAAFRRNMKSALNIQIMSENLETSSSKECKSSAMETED
ncbi:hypothetical protein O3M35_004886 [Rhynocoris fuscipes]|uniref:Uncharacterized protein n=1 Tax=Rhynocoris fuscipes TaxID=488301 RepID=A0AAW1DH21_9HEMI